MVNGRKPSVFVFTATEAILGSVAGAVCVVSIAAFIIMHYRYVKHDGLLQLVTFPYFVKKHFTLKNTYVFIS